MGLKVAKTTKSISSFAKPERASLSSFDPHGSGSIFSSYYVSSFLNPCSFLDPLVISVNNFDKSSLVTTLEGT
jgi:hypothetical protein